MFSFLSPLYSELSIVSLFPSIHYLFWAQSGCSGSFLLLFWAPSRLSVFSIYSRLCPPGLFSLNHLFLAPSRLSVFSIYSRLCPLRLFLSTIYSWLLLDCLFFSFILGFVFGLFLSIIYSWLLLDCLFVFIYSRLCLLGLFLSNIYSLLLLDRLFFHLF
jgi:hypothetical protein